MTLLPETTNDVGDSSTLLHKWKETYNVKSICPSLPLESRNKIDFSKISLS